jgi:hypothetical protein
LGEIKMKEAQQLRESFAGLYEVLSEAFASLRKAIMENVDKMIWTREKAQEYIEKRKAIRKGWVTVFKRILTNQVDGRKPARILARSNC